MHLVTEMPVHPWRSVLHRAGSKCVGTLEGVEATARGAHMITDANSARYSGVHPPSIPSGGRRTHRTCFTRLQVPFPTFAVRAMAWAAVLLLQGSLCWADVPCWNVDEVRPGMKGTGKTVLKGVDLVDFEAEVLGVMKNVAPSRDMVLVRLSGSGLEHTGVIAGMSGSPVYIDGKLLGAVAYTWPFGKEPIAGVTPFSQMQAFGNPSVERDRSATAADAQWSFPELLAAAVQIESLPAAAAPKVAMQPIQMPLSCSGFGPQGLRFVQQTLGSYGLLPLQGGAAGEAVLKDVGDRPLEPGAPLAVALMTGDMDLTGIGTVTHVDGDRVWGWGHPFMGRGECEYALRSGYIHAVYPSLNISTKLGSGLKTIGTVTSDVGTCVAGRLGPGPDMLPVSTTVQWGLEGTSRTYHVQIVRDPTLLGPLLASVLGGVLEPEGSLPDELTLDLRASVNAAGHEPIQLRDMYSGSLFSGDRGWAAIVNQVATIATALARNPFESVKLKSIDCHVQVLPGRRAAQIESAELNSNRFEPGETLVLTASLRPYKEAARPVRVQMSLPDDLSPGRYELQVSDFNAYMQRKLRDEAYLMQPRNLDQVVRAFREQLADTRNTLFLRVTLPPDGVALEGNALPQLPNSVRLVLSSGSRRTISPPIRRALIVKHPTDWVIEGAQRLSFQVVRNKKVFP